MKKITYLFISTCALTFISNSFGMLNQKNLIHRITTHKNIKYFCINNDLLKENNALLEKVIEQNKENNNLLRIIIQQNYLHSDYKHHPEEWRERYSRICDLYHKIEKDHNIKIEVNGNILFNRH